MRNNKYATLNMTNIRQNEFKVKQIPIGFTFNKHKVIILNLEAPAKHSHLPTEH